MQAGIGSNPTTPLVWFHRSWALFYNKRDARAFKKNDATVGTWYLFSYGGYDAEGQRTYSESVTTHFFARLGTPAVVFSIYDSDSPSGDDFMGSIILSASADYNSGIDLGDAKIKFRFVKF